MFSSQDLSAWVVESLPGCECTTDESSRQTPFAALPSNRSLLDFSLLLPKRGVAAQRIRRTPSIEP
jgi:hypothetical protein